jgi:UDP-glucose 4-epimerase
MKNKAHTTILVTGGAGFIGSHLVRAYHEAGYRVVVVDDLSSGLKNRIPKGVRFYRADIRSDEMVKIVVREKPQVINHHAAQVSVPVSVDRPELDTDINVKGTVNLLKAAGAAGCVKQFIFASSGGAVYGNTVKPAKEIDATSPLSVYGQSKLAAEGFVQLLSDQYGFGYTILRYANVYGPEQGTTGEAGVIGVFVEKALQGKPMELHGRGKQTRDFVYVDDVVEMNLRVTKKPKSGIFNVATGAKTSIREVADAVVKLTNLDRSHIVRGPRRTGDVGESVLNPARARKTFGWKAKMPLAIGLEKTCGWWHEILPVRKHAYISVTLVVPLFNEAKRVGRLLRSLEMYTVPLGMRLAEVRLVSDGSRDATVSLLRRWQKRAKVPFKVKIMAYAQNRGRGYALRRGLQNLSTDYGVYIDGDLDIPLHNLERLVKPMRQGIGVIMGSKKMPGAVCTQKRKPLRVIMGYAHTLLAAIMLGQWRWDWQGGFKAFSQEVIEEVFEDLRIDHWGFDMEVAFLAKQQGFRVIEVPLVWGAVTAQSSVRAWQDSAQALKDMVLIRGRWLALRGQTSVHWGKRQVGELAAALQSVIL